MTEVDQTKNSNNRLFLRSVFNSEPYRGEAVFNIDYNRGEEGFNRDTHSGGWQGGLPPALAGTRNASPRHLPALKMLPPALPCTKNASPGTSLY